MRRVHRSLEADQVKALRDMLTTQLPQSDLPIGDVIRRMRISVKRSQSEYAKLCGVAPRALADVEAGTGNPTLKTLQALLLPFACGVGVVRLSDEELRKRFSRKNSGKNSGSPAVGSAHHCEIMRASPRTGSNAPNASCFGERAS